MDDLSVIYGIRPLPGTAVVSTTPYTAVKESFILVDASGGARTVNLPAAAANPGRTYCIVKTDSSANAVTVDGNASETINGATTAVLPAQYDTLMIACDGSNWFILGAKTHRVDIYTTPGANTWTKYPGAKAVQGTLIAVGGPGGSGRKGAAGTVRCGGGGGAGSGRVEFTLPASILGATETVTIGAVGTVGAAVSASNTDGNAGAKGTDTKFGTWFISKAGAPGLGGTNATGTGGGAVYGWPDTFAAISLGIGANASVTGGAGTTGGYHEVGPCGGGSGGGINTGNGASGGGAGGLNGLPTVSDSYSGYGVSINGGGGGAVNTVGGTGGNSPANSPIGGGGGGGGGASTTTNAGAGGPGGNYGAGGGGGGAAVNAVGNSGAGGQGGAAIAIIITLF